MRTNKPFKETAYSVLLVMSAMPAGIKLKNLMMLPVDSD